MDRKIGLGAGALAIALGASLGAGVAGASRLPVTLSGAMTCSMAGRYNFSTGLTSAGGQATTVTVKAQLSNCSGPGSTNGAVSVSGGSLVATSAATIPNSLPAVLGGAPLPALIGTIKWKASGGKVTTTAVTLGAQAFSYDSSTNLVSLYATPALTGGSYASQSASTSGEAANSPGTTLLSKAASGGVSMIAFGKGAGTISIGA